MVGKVSPFRLAVQILVVAILIFNLFYLIRVWQSLGGKFGDFLGFKKAAEQVKKRQKFQIVTLTDSSCQVCSSLDEVIKFIKDSEVEISKEEKIDFNSNKDQALKLAATYRLTKLPVLILKGPRPEDPQVAQFWDNFGEVIDGDFVLRKIQPPYKDLISGEVRGQFKVTFLSDKSCLECYNVNLHKNAFQRLSMTVVDSVDIDVKSVEGKALVKKYNIKLVPTILIEGELDEYEGFQAVWPSVGTKEEDGIYVFRGVERMGIHKDLKTGKVIEGSAAAAPKADR